MNDTLAKAVNEVDAHTSPPAMASLWLRIAPIALGLAALYLPSFYDLSQTIWKTEDQGHGPLILAASAWLIWSERGRALGAASRPAGWPAWLMLMFGLAVYVLGRTQSVIMFEVGSLIPVLGASIALTFGWRSLYAWRVPILFLAFMMPLPGFVIDSLTSPLKLWVSTLAETLLHLMGYAVAREGVTLTVGQYQLLVADACSGLNSMVSLSAVGFFYIYLMARKNTLHNLLLLISIPVVAFLANVVRVIVICLVTYHLGDEAGQGFIHGAAGVVLFGVSLTLLFTLDALLTKVFRPKLEKSA